MTKSNRYFREFFRCEVNLGRRKLQRLQTSVRAMNLYLADNLTAYQRIDRQGSYGLGTLIKPVIETDGYDADMQVVMNPISRWQPTDYLNALNQTLRRNTNYVDKIQLRTRCVTVAFVGDFRLDLVPRVTRNGKHFICNKVTNEFEETDGTNYRDWFNQKSSITNANLKRVVRLLKFFRDHQRNYVAKSILLTTMCGKAIHPSDRATDAVSSVAGTLDTVLTRIDRYLQRHRKMPPITNPVLPLETFNRHWNQNRYTYFRDRMHAHATIVRNALDTASIERSTEI